MDQVIELELMDEFLEVWFCFGPHGALDGLSGPKSQATASFVILSEQPEVQGPRLRFRASRASLQAVAPNPGTGVGKARVVLVLADPEVPAPLRSLFEPGVEEEGGDERFLASLPRRGHFGSIGLARQLLCQVRRTVKGELVRSEDGQIWTNEPGREWAIKYQPRKRDFLVSIHGSPAEHLEVAREQVQIKDVDLKPNRSKYTRFYLADEDEVEDAIRLIKNAARLRQR
ncbi:MAG TPA: hypothetical protein PK668_12675 [Myxococcota bacterium]|nr:hypothetical protein [Myxococcota bacterium]HRY93675.1 hypothetical protein [Myxococcota bacterium]